MWPFTCRCVRAFCCSWFSFQAFSDRKILEVLKILLLAVSAAMVYGTVHDQITARVCVEYFTIAHPWIFPTESPTWLGLVWGIIATWWVGLILGIPAAWLARVGKTPRLDAEDLIRPLAVLLGATGLFAILAGVVSYGLARAGLIASPQSLNYQIVAEHHAAFLAVAASHLASYGGGFVGGIVLCVWIRRQRRVESRVRETHQE